jgi:hypothetical protein
VTLEGHWPLTEDSGSTAYDYSGNENHGSITGAGPAGTGTVTGLFGNSAYDFDGSDDILSIPNFGTFSSITVVAWATTDVVDGNDYDVLALRENNSIILRQDISNEWQFAVQRNDDNGTFASIVTQNGINSGEWYHLVGTWDGSTVTFYVNGVSVGTDTASDTKPDQNGGDYIGSLENSGKYFDGTIADVRIYDRAISPQEVQALYQAGTQSEVIFE